MNWVDLVVVGLAVLAAVSGARQGVIIALPAFLGVLVGGILGVLIAPLVVGQISAKVTQVAFAFAIFVLFIALGETVGVWIGRTIRQKISSPRFTPADNVLGAIVQALVVFLVCWLIGSALSTVSNLPTLASAINRSVVLGAVDDAMPTAAQDLPAKLRKSLDDTGFPAVVDPFNRAPAKEVAPPDPELQASAVVQRVRPSVLKIRAKAPPCERALEGSGFVIAPQRVMTNAHVIAGASEVTVESGDRRLPAEVVYYDSDTDVAVLSVPRLAAPTMAFAEQDAESGQDSIVLGYPLDGPYTASPSRVRDRIPLEGPNIYDSRTVRRDVFTLRAVVRSGNSGGPLIDTQGQVIGVVFGAAVDNSDTGFALTADAVRDVVNDAPDLSSRVATGHCAA